MYKSSWLSRYVPILTKFEQFSYNDLSYFVLIRKIFYISLETFSKYFYYHTRQIQSIKLTISKYSNKINNINGQ